MARCRPAAEEEEEGSASTSSSERQSRLRAALPGPRALPVESCPRSPAPSVPGAAGADPASGPGRGLARRQRGRPLGRGCPPCWFGSRTAPLQLQEEAHVQGRSQTVPVVGLMSSFPLHTPSGVFPGLAAWERVCSGNEPNVCLQRSAWPLQYGPRMNAVWSRVDPGEVPTLPAASSPETARDPLGRNRSGVSCGPQGPSNCVQNKS